MSLSKTEHVLCNVITDMTFHHFCYILLARSKSQFPPTLKEKELHKSKNQKVGVLQYLDGCLNKGCYIAPSKHPLGKVGSLFWDCTISYILLRGAGLESLHDTWCREQGMVPARIFKGVGLLAEKWPVDCG